MDEGHIRLHPFDPDSGSIPEIAEFGPLAERSEGRGIILIAAPDVDTSGWCARAAAALATKWSAQGARILLADVSLTQPVLHEVFDLPNSEGIADVMMNDAQLRTVGRTVGSPKFPFISAGTPAGDVADVMRSARWDVVLQALEDADVHLVMYAPADLPGLDALLRRNPAVLLLGGNPEAATEAIGPLGLSESVGLGPAVGEGASGDEGASAIEGASGEIVVSSDEAVAGKEGASSTRFRVLELVGGSSDTPTDATDSTGTVGKQSFLRRVPLWKMAVALGLLVLLAWAGSRLLRGEGTGSSDVSEEPAESSVPEESAESLVSEQPVESAVPVIPPETPQAYSLSLAAFEDGGVAALRAGALARRRVGQGLSSNSGRTSHGFGVCGGASNVIE